LTVPVFAPQWFLEVFFLLRPRKELFFVGLYHPSIHPCIYYQNVVALCGYDRRPGLQGKPSVLHIGQVSKMVRFIRKSHGL